MADLLLNLLVDSRHSLNPQKDLDLDANLICKFPLKRLPITSGCLVVSLIQLLHTLSQDLLCYFSNNRFWASFEHQFLLYDSCYIIFYVRFFIIHFEGLASVYHNQRLFKFLGFPM